MFVFIIDFFANLIVNEDILFWLLKVWTTSQRYLLFVVKLSFKTFLHIFSIYISVYAATGSGMNFPSYPAYVQAPR